MTSRPNSPGPDLTEVVDAVRVGTGLVHDDELEIVGCLVDDHACVGVAAVDDLAQVIPCMLFHLELGGVHILHLHHLCAVRELVRPCHRCQSRSDPVGTRREIYSKPWLLFFLQYYCTSFFLLMTKSRIAQVSLWILVRKAKFHITKNKRKLACLIAYL